MLLRREGRRPYFDYQGLSKKTNNALSWKSGEVAVVGGLRRVKTRQKEGGGEFSRAKTGSALTNRLVQIFRQGLSNL